MAINLGMSTYKYIFRNLIEGENRVLRVSVASNAKTGFFGTKLSVFSVYSLAFRRQGTRYIKIHTTVGGCL